MSAEIIHGDCLDVLRGMESASVDAVVTDPPYGMSYQSAWRSDREKRLPRIAGDERPFIWWLYDAARALRDGGALLTFCEWRHAEFWRQAIACAGLAVRSQVIWDRDWHGMGDTARQVAPCHDVAWFATKGRFAWHGKRPRSVLRHRRTAPNDLTHPAEKPVALMTDIATFIAPPGALIVDPFCGTGSTGVACVETGRRFIGIEREAAYVDIARRRIAEAEAQRALALGVA